MFHFVRLLLRTVEIPGNAFGLSLALVMATCSGLQAATYYVAPTGSDTNGGSISLPWLTVTRAATAVAPGDTVLVRPGIYDNLVLFNVNGSSNRPIVFKADGPVTNLGTWRVESSWLVIDGFEWTLTGTKKWGTLSGCVVIGQTNAANVKIVNNKFHDNLGGWISPIVAHKDANMWNYSTDILVSNNVFSDYIQSYGVCNVSGTNWTIVNNTISNTFGGDAFQVWGQGHIIRGNLAYNVGNDYVKISGAGNPSVNGYYYHCWELQTNWNRGFIHTNIFGYVVANGSDSWASYGWSNKWNLCSPNGTKVYATASYPQGPWAMLDTAIGSAPKGGGGYMDHPDFIQSWGPWNDNTNNPFYPGLMSSNILIEGNVVIGGYLGAIGQLNSGGGMRDRTMGSHWNFQNNVFVNLAGCSVDVSDTVFYNNVFYKCGNGTPSLVFSWNNPLGNPPRGEPYRCKVYNNAFIACGTGSTSVGWYQWNCAGGYADPTQWGGAPFDLASNCDYNYVCNSTEGWTQKAVGTSWGGNVWKFFEPNGINGGDPQLINVAALDFRPRVGSPWIDRGTNVCGNDGDGATRPLGATSDIGAYEFDSKLLVRLEFNAATPSANRVVDATGMGHDAINFNATNWISYATGPRGHIGAGVWTVVGIMTNDPGKVYNLAQYAAITNIDDIQFITNGAIAVWVQWATNAERWDTILDSGYSVAYSAKPAVATNSWWFRWGRTLTESSGDSIGPVFARWTDNLSSPNGADSTLIAWPPTPRDGRTWWHLAVVWSGTSNTIVGYQNGQPFVTNSLGMPYLRVSGSKKWLSLGAMQHDGTPQWGDDMYPNSGFFKGKMADLRIYGRPLTAEEIDSLYSNPNIHPALTPSIRPAAPRQLRPTKPST